MTFSLTVITILFFGSTDSCLQTPDMDLPPLTTQESTIGTDSTGKQLGHSMSLIFNANPSNITISTQNTISESTSSMSSSIASTSTSTTTQPMTTTEGWKLNYSNISTTLRTLRWVHDRLGGLPWFCDVQLTSAMWWSSDRCGKILNLEQTW